MLCAAAMQNSGCLLRHATRLALLSTALLLGAGCAPEVDVHDTASQSGTVSGRVTSPRPERVEHSFSLIVRGEGVLVERVRDRSVNEIPGAVVFDQTEDANAFRRAEATGWLARDPRTGRYYYNAEAREAAAVLRDLEDPTPGLITVEGEVTDEGERVVVRTLSGARWERLYPAAQVRDRREACVAEILAEVQRQYDLFRNARP